MDACPCNNKIVILDALTDLIILKDSVHYNSEAENKKYDPHKINAASPLSNVQFTKFRIFEL